MQRQKPNDINNAENMTNINNKMSPTNGNNEIGTWASGLQGDIASMK